MSYSKIKKNLNIFILKLILVLTKFVGLAGLASLVGSAGLSLTTNTYCMQKPESCMQNQETNTKNKKARVRKKFKKGLFKSMTTKEKGIQTLIASTKEESIQTMLCQIKEYTRIRARINAQMRAHRRTVVMNGLTQEEFATTILPTIQEKLKFNKLRQLPQSKNHKNLSSSKIYAQNKNLLDPIIIREAITKNTEPPYQVSNDREQLIKQKQIVKPRRREKCLYMYQQEALNPTSQKTNKLYSLPT